MKANFPRSCLYFGCSCN